MLKRNSILPRLASSRSPRSPKIVGTASRCSPHVTSARRHQPTTQSLTVTALQRTFGPHGAVEIRPRFTWRRRTTLSRGLRGLGHSLAAVPEKSIVVTVSAARRGDGCCSPMSHSLATLAASAHFLLPIIFDTSHGWLSLLLLLLLLLSGGGGPRS